MRQITHYEALSILRETDPALRDPDPDPAKMGEWICHSEKNGQGDYGHDDTYFFNGKPIVKISVAFLSPYTVAWDLR